MHGPLLPPVAHLPFDDAGVDPVATILQHFLGNLRHQVVIPPAATPTTRRALGQPTPEDVQGPGERKPTRVDPLGRSRLLHEHPDDIMPNKRPYNSCTTPVGVWLRSTGRSR